MNFVLLSSINFISFNIYTYYNILMYMCKSVLLCILFLPIISIGICSGTSPAPSSTTVPSNGYLLINETEKLEKKITEIKTNLTVPVNTTSQYLRSKSCTNDERTSSRAMGMVLGAGLLSALAAFILFPDLQTVCSHILKGICNLCRKRKQQNQLLK